MQLKEIKQPEACIINQNDLFQILPFNYSQIQVSKEQRPVGFRFYKNTLTIAAKLRDKEIIVCGEDENNEIAVSKAISELIERSALIELAAHNPEIHKTSNGWAAHFDQETAELNAVLEIAERDGVLAQWYSQTPFIEIDVQTLPQNITSWVKTELAVSEFPIFKVLLSTKGIGPSVTCVFMNSSGFGVCGHSSKLELSQSIENAIGEACRAAHLTLRNAHYRDSEVLKNGGEKKINPGAHVVYYAYHEAFPEWMFSQKISWLSGQKLWNERMTRLMSSRHNFKIKTVMTTPLFVSYAKHPQAFELFWGSSAPMRALNSSAAYRLNNKEINLKPHLIS